MPYRESTAMQAVDAINSLGKEFNGYKRKLIEIPKLNYTNYDEINDLLNQLELKTYMFNKIFSSDNDSSFDPLTLSFNANFLAWLDYNEDRILFKFKTSVGKTFLCYLGKSIEPNYLWELITTSEEEAVEDTEADTEDEEEDEEF
jgi:hypothetical protein